MLEVIAIMSHGYFNVAKNHSFEGITHIFGKVWLFEDASLYDTIPLYNHPRIFILMWLSSSNNIVLRWYATNGMTCVYYESYWLMAPMKY